MTNNDGWCEEIVSKFNWGDDFPLTSGWTFFLRGKVDFVKDGPDYIGFRVQQDVCPIAMNLLKELGYSFNTENTSHGSWVEVRGNRALFQRCYRSKVCKLCCEKKLSTDFQWKHKGAEGPFSQLWGIRSAICRRCEKKKKAGEYLNRKKISIKDNLALKKLSKKPGRLCDPDRMRINESTPFHHNVDGIDLYALLKNFALEVILD